MKPSKPVTNSVTGPKRSCFGRGVHLFGAAIMTVASVVPAGAAEPGPVVLGPVVLGPATKVFGFTGTTGTYVVPAGTCAVWVRAAGAQGGTWTPPEEVLDDEWLPLPGGSGGVTESNLTVEPGETLLVTVGGRGGDGGAEIGGGRGGFNGGGDGGGDGSGGGGGGGASDVRRGGVDLEDRVVVAGGGGGVGTDAVAFWSPEWGVPGVGGNPATPGGGERPTGTDSTPAGGGGAGTGTEGGAGGRSAVEDSAIVSVSGGRPGSFGAGGRGAGVDGHYGGGGGGGGGWFGGGGGGLGRYVMDGSGGGGSSLGDSTTPGMRSGDGEVMIIPVVDCASEVSDERGSGDGTPTPDPNGQNRSQETRRESVSRPRSHRPARTSIQDASTVGSAVLSSEEQPIGPAVRPASAIDAVPTFAG